jgi:hypothetical protein
MRSVEGTLGQGGGCSLPKPDPGEGLGAHLHALGGGHDGDEVVGHLGVGVALAQHAALQLNRFSKVSTGSLQFNWDFSKVSIVIARTTLQCRTCSWSMSRCSCLSCLSAGRLSVPMPMFCPSSVDWDSATTWKRGVGEVDRETDN